MKFLLLSSALFFSAVSFSNPVLEGTWQGPCENRADKSVKFLYNIVSEGDNTGKINKEKTYFSDNDCVTEVRRKKQTVPYTTGEVDENGIFPLDVEHKGRTLFDIVTVSECEEGGVYLVFGKKYSTKVEERPTELSEDDRVFTLVEKKAEEK